MDDAAVRPTPQGQALTHRVEPRRSPAGLATCATLPLAGLPANHLLVRSSFRRSAHSASARCRQRPHGAAQPACQRRQGSRRAVAADHAGALTTLLENPPPSGVAVAGPGPRWYASRHGHPAAGPRQRARRLGRRGESQRPQQPRRGAYPAPCLRHASLGSWCQSPPDSRRSRPRFTHHHRRVYALAHQRPRRRGALSTSAPGRPHSRRPTRLAFAAIFRRDGPTYRATWGHHMPPSHRQGMADMDACRTEALGGHVFLCEPCQA
jgi:Transposase zinc-binding domain